MHSQRVTLKGKKKVFLRVDTDGTGGEVYTIRVVDLNGKIWYLRDLKDDQAVINLPLHEDIMKVDVSRGSITSILVGDLTPVTIPYLNFHETFRPYEMDQIKFIKNPLIKTPARMFTKYPVIEYNPDKMARYWIPVQHFIFWHEIAHNHFDNEVKADTWATITFLNQGWNLSTAIYALTRVLKKSPEKTKRMLYQNELLKNLSRRYYG